MSKRFQRWAEAWIEESVIPHVNADIESNDARAARLTDKLFADAAAAGFSKFEIDEERTRFTRQVRSVIVDAVDFDVDAYVLKSRLAMENEDGD